MVDCRRDINRVQISRGLLISLLRHGQAIAKPCKSIAVRVEHGFVAIVLESRAFKRSHGVQGRAGPDSYHATLLIISFEPGLALHMESIYKAGITHTAAPTHPLLYVPVLTFEVKMVFDMYLSTWELKSLCASKLDFLISI